MLCERDGGAAKVCARATEALRAVPRAANLLAMNSETRVLCLEAEELRRKLPAAPPTPPPAACAGCGAPAKKLCSGCLAVTFCTRECQLKHWPSH